MTENVELTAALEQRLNEALQAANYRITLATQKENARLKYINDLNYSAHGGLFHVTTDLIAFVSCLVNLEKDSAVLIDSKNSPIDIPDIKKFLDDITDLYYQASNEYLTEFRALQKSRTPKALVGA